MPTFALITLGCKVNQHDSQAIREALAGRGWAEVPPSEAADLYIVNTCCVTAQSGRKSRRWLRRLARKHPEAVLVAAGCGVDADAEAFREIPGVRCVVGNAEKPRLADIAAAALGQPSGEAALPSAWPSISSFAGHTRAFVKVEDGCNAFCSYCIVPYVRGRVRSRPPDQVVAEVRRLVDAGYLEVVLTGIHLGAYGLETGGKWALVPLLQRLVAVPGLRRLRLSSIEPGEVADELVRLAAGPSVLCPHFHIPLQSGDDDVLRAMNRHYTTSEFLARVDAIRERIDDAAVTSDVIVGFPGETDEQFRHTVAAVRRAAFGRLHVFTYSDREGTAASRMGGKVSRHVIDGRRHEVLAVAAELAAAYHRRFLGRSVEPLVEASRDRRTGLLCGYTERYVRAFFAGPDAHQGQIVALRVTGADSRGVAGHP